MKKTNNMEIFTDREWEELAAHLSGERSGNGEIFSRFAEEDNYNTGKYWNDLREMNSEREINPDRAWDRLYSRLRDNELMNDEPEVKKRFLRPVYYRVAAAVLLVIAIGSALLYMNRNELFSRRTIVATGGNQKNLEHTLPDGSTVILNRNTRITYPRSFSMGERNVTLEGEAFFSIVRDDESPFTVDAGKVRIRALGTSFNVRTSDQDSPVEIFVKTGQVLVTCINTGSDIVLDSGFIGSVYSDKTGKALNTDPNYMSWNTGLLVYDGQTLDIVFRDLKRVYNMNIVADDPEILSNTWTSPIDNQAQETIIRLICASFNLAYEKDGDVYHLTRK